MADAGHAHALLSGAVNGRRTGFQKQFERGKPSKLEQLLGNSRSQLSKSECVEVAFHHAGYDPALYSNTVMFRLKGAGGVPWNIASMIFFILCADSDIFNTSRFALSRDRPSFEGSLNNAILRRSNYYVRCRNPNDLDDLHYKYSIIPDFECWEMPKMVPKLWPHNRAEGVVNSRSTVGIVKNPTELEWVQLCKAAVLARDQKCAMTGAEANCGRAYLVPEDQRGFYQLEKLSEHLDKRSFGHDELDFHHAMNGITLRNDLLYAYNEGEFIFMPAGEHWVAHFFDPVSKMGCVYHQRPIRLSAEIPKGYLLVRVAITTFESARGFLEQGRRCEVALDNTKELAPIGHTDTKGSD